MAKILAQAGAVASVKKTLTPCGTGFIDTYTLRVVNKTYGTAVRTKGGFAFTPANGTQARDNHKVIPTMAGIKLMIDAGHFEGYAGKADAGTDSGAIGGKDSKAIGGTDAKTGTQG